MFTALTLGSCADDPVQPGPVDPIETALAAAEHFLTQVEIDDPYLHLAQNVLHRRYGVSSFEQAAAEFDAAMSTSEQATLLGLFRRIHDCAEPFDPQGYEQVVSLLDRISLAALYCDAVPWPEDWNSLVAEALERGAYGTTHVALAIIWAEERGCGLPLDPETRGTVVDAMSELVFEGPPDDLTIEAAAMLQQMGEGARIAEPFHLNMLAVQNPDGGWSRSAGSGQPSHWHTTFVAAWFLRERSVSEPRDTMATTRDCESGSRGTAPIPVGWTTLK